MKLIEVCYRHPSFPKGKKELFLTEEEFKRFKHCNRFFHTRIFCLNGEGCEFKKVCKNFDEIIRIRIIEKEN